ncbi:MAG: PilZ domain-containing protein [Bryobacteraceae bacterium]|nr:PilZ domain-containing protein [Bryobacteraceae bacterium]MCX7603404.1 PilZ domain-containing protein [Bryobacteraceae bacterium]
MIDRRSEPRMLCADLVDVRWKDQNGKTRRAVANLEDISFSGACLQLETRVPVGAPMRISYAKGEFAGVVRYCMFKDIGYFVGVQFEPGYKWDEREFRPMHLLDPRTLMQRAPHRVKQDYPRPKGQ